MNITRPPETPEQYDGEDEPEYPYNDNFPKEEVVPKFIPDSIVKAVSQRFIDRAKFGWKKYGTNLDRTDLSTTEWIQHFQDEIHDAYVYSEKLKQDEIKRNRLLDLALELNNYFEFLMPPDEINKDKVEYETLLKWYNEQKKEEKGPNTSSGNSIY